MATSEQLLVQAARFYYEHNLTQAEIGRKLNTSRSTVSRLLQEARDTGVVRVQINYPWKRDVELERALLNRYQLREAHVLKSMDRPDDEIYRGMGMLAAEFFDGFVKDDMILGVSYGRSVASMLEQLVPTRHVSMTVVQILGALGIGNPLIEGPDLVRQIANLYGATYRYLYAPLIVESPQTRDLLLKEPYVNETLGIGRKADAIVMGIGAHYAAASGLIWTGYLNKKDMTFLKSRGAVGHMCAQHFDRNGDVLDVPFNRQVISIGIEALREIETVVAIAGSAEKAEAIRGALQGRYLDVLITDDHAARRVLALA